MANRSTRSLLIVLLLGLAGSCGDEPQRISKSGSKSPPPATSAATVRLAGRVQLMGGLVQAQNGAVFMIARSGGRTALVHKYDMTGPQWSTRGDERVLSFSLTDEDNMGGAGAPVGMTMELEARYDPEGFVDTKPGVEKKGVVKSFASVAIGDTKISLKLDPAVSPTPAAPPTTPVPQLPPGHPGKPSGG